MNELLHIFAHMGNCHGELNMLPVVLSFIESVPFIRAWRFRV